MVSFWLPFQANQKGYPQKRDTQLSKRNPLLIGLPLFPERHMSKKPTDRAFEKVIRAKHIEQIPRYVYDRDVLNKYVVPFSRGKNGSF